MRSPVTALLLLSALGVVGCGTKRDLSGSEAVDSGPTGFELDGGSGDPDVGGAIDLEAGAAYAVLGVQPSHGPWSGGTRVELRGRGFSSRTAVRIGGVDVAPADVVATDPFHVQVVTPPGEPGPADIVVTDVPTGQTAVLPFGFTYDLFRVDPNSGSTAGGTLITLVGRDTQWIAGTTVTIDGKACEDLVVRDATHIACVTPVGLPGSRAVSVTMPDKVVTTVRDAYTYADTSDGYRGGLAGEKLPGELKVVAVASNGDLIAAATVVVRGIDGTVQTKQTSVAGVATFPAPPPAPLTVTVTKKCMQPNTFDGVQVQAVTAYLSPVYSTACIPPDGQPPPVGGKQRYGGSVLGELVWPGGIEFRRAAWKGVPEPRSKTQRAAAYVLPVPRDNLARFYLPDASTATLPDSPGTIGYEFSLTTNPGNLTLYAVAGIEDRPTDGRPPTFEPYVYGIVRGVGVNIGGTTDRVQIPMTGTFSHAVRHAISGIPLTGRGPDRARTTLAIDIGDGFIPLPQGPREDLLPLYGDLSFVGVPPLTGALANASYVTAVEAVTGGSGGIPTSAILRFRHRTSGQSVPISGFVPIPKFLSPAVAGPWDGHTVKLDLPANSADLIAISLGAGDGSSSWWVYARGDARSIQLPDFAASPELGLPPGNLILGAYAIKIDGFDYDQLRNGQLSRSAWSAYAYDTAYGYW